MFNRKLHWKNTTTSQQLSLYNMYQLFVYIRFSDSYIRSSLTLTFSYNEKLREKIRVHTHLSILAWSSHLQKRNAQKRRRRLRSITFAISILSPPSLPQLPTNPRYFCRIRLHIFTRDFPEFSFIFLVIYSGFSNTYSYIFNSFVIVMPTVGRFCL